MRRLAITLTFALAAVLVPSWAWALPFAGATFQVCEPLENASIDRGGPASGGEGTETETSPSCELVRFDVSEELDLTRGWAPVCDPAGASGVSGVYIYEPRSASVSAASFEPDCSDAHRLDRALVQGTDQPGPDGAAAAVGWAILPDVLLLPAGAIPAPWSPVSQVTATAADYTDRIYRPPLP